MITARDVQARVDAMGEFVAARDWEAAHEYEWHLWEDVLTAIARGEVEGASIATLALQVRRYNYPRCW